MSQEIQSQYAKLILFFEKDIKSFHCLIINKEKLLIKIPEKAKSLIEISEKKVIEYQAIDSKKNFEINIISINDRVIEIELLDETSSFSNDKFHSIDYKGSIEVACVDENSYESYLDLVESINYQNKDDLSKKIRETILSGYEDPVILNFLGAINAKIDKILEILTPEKEIENSFNVRCVSLSGEGFLFYCDKDLENYQLFVTSLLVGSGVRVKFASICDVERVYKNIWKAMFININETIRDEIVKFIFSKEREILKEAKL